MTGQTSSAFASLVTVRFMQSEETDGMADEVIHTNDGRDGHFIKISKVRVGAVKILKFKDAGERCRPFVCTFCVFGRGIKPIIVKTL